MPGCCCVWLLYDANTGTFSNTFVVFCFQAEDGIRDLVRSRGLGDVYKRQAGLDAQYLGRQLADFRDRRRGSGAGDTFGAQMVTLSLIHI